jgi:hypothetical protein
MEVVVYGAEKVPSGFRVVKSVEELRRHVGKAFLVVVGDRELAEELGLRIFRRRSGGIFCGGMRKSTGGGERPQREESRVYPPNALLRRALQEEGRSRGGSDV